MRPREFAPGVYTVGYQDWDRRLFDALVPLPDGTSYNSYLVRGSEKAVLIETVDHLPEASAEFLNNLTLLGIQKLDYVIANHAEPDHTGTLPQVLARFPEAKVLCTERCRGMLIDLHAIDAGRLQAVADGATVSLGDRTLEFIHAAWVHWPETMFTYLREEAILFPCDFLGSHLATTDLFATDEARVYEAARRYYAEIMMPFRTSIQNHLKKLQQYQIKMIAPSHGPIYGKPQFILDAYGHWVNDELSNIVVLPYVSMHGATHKMVEYLVAALVQRGVTVKCFELTTVDTGRLASALVDAGTVVIGTPTVLAGPHPLAAYAAVLANALRPKVRFASVIGSFGWGGKCVETLAGLLPNLKVEMLPTVLAKGTPREADYQALERLAETIAQKHKEAGFK